MRSLKGFASIVIVLILLFTFGCAGNSADSTSQQLTQKSTAKVLDNDVQISFDTNDQATPAVAYNTVNNNYLTVWTDTRKGSSDIQIYGAICTGSGSGTSTAMSCGTEIAIATATGNQTQPKVAFYPNGGSSKYLVIWTDARSRCPYRTPKYSSRVWRYSHVHASIADFVSRSDPAGDLSPVSTQNDFRRFVAHPKGA